MSEQTQEPSTEVAELVSSINEAKEVIAAETVEIDKKQRKAGRPKGVKDSKPRKIKNELSDADSQPSMDESQLEVTPAMILPMLEGVVKFPFDIAASRTGCEKLKLTEEEARPTVAALDQFLKYYMPDMEKADPKIVAAFTLLTSTAFLGYAKFQTYADWKAEESKTLDENKDQSEKSENQSAPAMPRERTPWEVTAAHV